MIFVLNLLAVLLAFAASLFFGYIIYQIGNSLLFLAGFFILVGILGIIQGFIFIKYRKLRGRWMTFWIKSFNIYGRNLSKSKMKKEMANYSRVEGNVAITMGIVFIIEALILLIIEFI